MPIGEGREQRAKSKEQGIAGVDIHPRGSLPRDAAYSMYMGSLTAPPCTEGIPCFVLKTPMEIPLRQINAFATTELPT
jgi:carbonic anhydrase